MFWEFPLKVQTWSTAANDWLDETVFENKRALLKFITDQWPDEPQFYNLKNTKKWKETGQFYTETQKATGRPNFEGGRYHNFIRNSPRHKEWKAKEKDRILNGVIYDGIYIPPFYYWYLNYCPIYDDLKKKKRFADVWDGDLWYMQYCMRAILSGKHIGGVKGRQKGYSYKHMSILYWSYSWFENSVNTVGAYEERLVKKSWRFLEGYRAHINAHTTWHRGPTIPKSLEWNETQMDDANKPQGLQSKLAGVTFKQKADNDVGGSQTFFNYEEPGVSPTILQTLEFIKPAVVKGSETTGIIIACGSVGELDDAEGIKNIFYNPEAYDFLPVKNVWDKDPLSPTCCIFVSEAYNMIGEDDETGEPFMDADGNSNVPLAMKWIKRQQELMKKSKKKAELKQLALSQKCTSPEQAFAQRTLSEFPVEMLKAQQERIKHKWANDLWDYKPQQGLLMEKDGRVVLDTANGGPEHNWPINPEWEDKRGVVTIYEPPDPGTENENYMYFAGVDPVEVEEDTISTSVASVDIFKTAVWVTYEENGKQQTKLEGDKLVATWRGRFSAPDKTNEQIWLLLKMYNAWGYAERNKPNFINYMRRMGRAEKYLAKEQDVPLFKDLNIKNGNAANNSKFGFHKGDNTDIWNHFKAQAKEYFFTEYGRIEDKDGEVTKVITGIDKIDDYWLLEEFINYIEGRGNYDRLVSFMAALFIAKVYQQNRFKKTRNEVKKKEDAERPKARKAVSLLGGGYASTRNMLNKKKKRPQSLL